ncbi:hypothetical protein [Streptomyces sp. NPDC002573]|uniref:hypothetical protein n=1 Tax=Streptomyces sp. NPDC002573 TaxID=3364651 RepID=UPI00367B1B05
MTATYRSDHAADPALFERLMRERYGPLDKVMAERKRPHPPAPDRRPVTAPAYQSKPDPDAARHLADLQEAISQPVGRPAALVKAPNGQPFPAASAPRRKPPAPGMTWCNSCDGWCTPQGICGCNNS